MKRGEDKADSNNTQTRELFMDGTDEMVGAEQMMDIGAQESDEDDNENQ